LLVETPLVDAPLVERLVAARGDADVAYPIRLGVPGHPVVFGPRPRAHIAALSDGDTLRTLRADPRWRRVEYRIDDDGPFTDVDTPEDLAQIASPEDGNGRRHFSE
jgi:CTP:molybdopterin cytidylyltransferase MocA